MKVDKNYPGLKRAENGDYILEGNLISDEDIIVDLDDRLIVTGSIKAGWYIEAGECIKAGRYIEAGECIKAGWYIEAGECIKAGTSIKAGEGYGIYAGVYVKNTNKKYRTITCPKEPKNIMCGVWEELKCQQDS